MNSLPANSSHRRWVKKSWRIVRLFLAAYLLVVLGMVFFENWLVYPIPPLAWGDWNPQGFAHEDIYFASDDGTKLHGWFVPHPNSSRAILYCHGNGEDVASSGEVAARLSEALQASVFVFDYRGYGRSAGRPNEAGCIADGTAAQHWLAKRAATNPSSVILMGRSLGSAVAVALAAQNGARALILENSFTSLPDIAAIHYPWLPVHRIMSNQYDNVGRIRHYSGPLLQSHGTADNLIPIKMAKCLFDASPSCPKKWLEFPASGHNDTRPNRYYRELADFLKANTPTTGGFSAVEPAI